MKSKSIKQALEHAANNPDAVLDLDAPVYVHVAHALFDIANRPDPKVRGSMARATRAQKLILDRMVGLRRSGTHPAVAKDDTIEFLDLTVMPVLEEKEGDDGQDRSESAV